MSESDNEMQATDEVAVSAHFQEYRRVFFDPCHSRQCFVLGRDRVPAHCSSSFVEAANRLQLQRTALDAVDESELVVAAGASYLDEDETSVSEGSEVRSAVDSERSPTSAGVIAETDHTLLRRQWTEPSCSCRASLTLRLRRTSSCELRLMSTLVQVKRQLSDSAALRRASSSYGSQDHSLQTSDHNEEPELYSGVTTPDNSDGSTVAFSADRFEPSQPSNVSLTMDFSGAEVSGNADAANVPFEVAAWQLNGENEFESVYMPGAATGGLEQEQFPPVGDWEAVQQTLSYQQINERICELHNRIVPALLVQLLQENCSPEFVQSVAQVLLLSAADAEAVGKSL